MARRVGCWIAWYGGGAAGAARGGIGDSVTWLVVGMATFGTLLAVVVR